MFFIGLEGISSCLFALNSLVLLQSASRTLSGRSVRYDRELGWAPVPNFSEDNYYAAGTALRINSQGLRADGAIAEQAAAGKIRMICSGDSFTFGEGADNERTWPRLLESRDNRLETVNMAEVGYGVDQMYLRYKRHRALKHDIHVLAFITDDLQRMRMTSLAGYEKPVLKLREGELVTENVPVAMRSSVVHWFARKPNPLLAFRSFAMAGAVLDQVGATGKAAQVMDGPSDELRPVVDQLLEDLKRMDSEKHSTLLLVCLPTRRDYEPGGASDGWRKFVREEAAQRDIPFIDLIEGFQRLPVTTKDGMFIWQGSAQRFAETPGHYNDQGNSYIANALYSKLIAMPEVSERLAVRSRTGGAVN